MARGVRSRHFPGRVVDLVDCWRLVGFRGLLGGSQLPTSKWLSGKVRESPPISIHAEASSNLSSRGRFAPGSSERSVSCRDGCSTRDLSATQSQQASGSPLRLRGRLLQYSYWARLVLACAHHYGFGAVAGLRVCACPVPLQLYGYQERLWLRHPITGTPFSERLLYLRRMVFPGLPQAEGARRAVLLIPSVDDLSYVAVGVRFGSFPYRVTGLPKSSPRSRSGRRSSGTAALFFQECFKGYAVGTDRLSYTSICSKLSRETGG